MYTSQLCVCVAGGGGGLSAQSWVSTAKLTEKAVAVNLKCSLYKVRSTSHSPSFL